MAKDLQFHEAANLFPMMTDEEANALLDDIRENGQKYAIELYDGKVLDGRNRYVQCLKLGIECDTVDVTADIDDPVKHVLSANLHRRHLTASQKSIIAGKADKLLERLKDDALKRMKEGGGDKKSQMAREKSGTVKLPDPIKGETREQLGKIIGISGSMVDRGLKVVEKGTPELVKAVEEGRMSVTNAAKLTEEDAETQKQAAEDAKFSGGRYRPVKIQKERDNTGADPNYRNTKQFALECARCAITQLEQIPKKNPGRKESFAKVEKWIYSQGK